MGHDLADAREVARALAAHGFEAEAAAAPPAAGEPRPDAAVVLHGGPAGDARAAIGRLLAPPLALPVLVLVPPAPAAAALEALKEGATDVARAPLPPEELALRVARLLALPAPRPAAAARPVELLGRSEAIARVRARIERAAPTRATVLLCGETGTGKEVAAHALHARSPRAAGPFVKVNCAALPETLLESELFGHERGAFTGAEARRRGRFEEAHGGTILLDEIGDMHPRVQAKVLRVLQEREFERLGGSRTIRVDVRIVAATNQPLEALVAEGRFREDLLYRLDVVRIELPPLRERTEDIPILAERFLREFARAVPRPPVGFAPDALRAMLAHPWPGNVRELRNAVERAVVLAEGEWIRPADLGLPSPGRAPRAAVRVELPPEGASLEAVERAAILAALERAGWVQRRAARLLGVTPRKLHHRIHRLGIAHPAWPRSARGARAREPRADAGVPGARAAAEGAERPASGAPPSGAARGDARGAGRRGAASGPAAGPARRDPRGKSAAAERAIPSGALRPAGVGPDGEPGRRGGDP